MIKKTIKLTLLLFIILAIPFFFDLDKEKNDPPKEEETPKEEVINEEIPKEEVINEEIPKKELPKVAIVIDDLGNNFNIDKTIEEIDANLTLAILPFRENSKRSADFFKEKQEIILHLPLEPISEDQKEEEMITLSMSREEIREFLSNALREFNVVGLNNHKGSLFTANEDSMRILLEEIGDMFFVDSFTIGSSKAYNLAKEMGIKTAKRDIFLDNSKNEEDIKDQLYELISIAEEKGSAIAIGHSFGETISVLREEVPKLRDRVSFVYVSEILD